MAIKKDYDKALYRYADILSRIALNERPDNSFFIQEYGVSQRTIQRDMKKLRKNFPIQRDTNGGWMFDYDFGLKGSTYSVDEAITFTNALNQIQKAGSEFDKSVDIIFRKLIFPTYKNPYYIKPPLYEYIDMNSPLMDKLEEAISYNNSCNIYINDILNIVNPYKIVNYDGIWYLFCENATTEQLEHIIIVKITKVEILPAFFIPRADIEDLLGHIDSPFYTENNIFEVIIEVSPKISEYFISKQHLPSQEILETKENGSLVIKYKVTHEEEIDNLIKSWLPDIKVIKPKHIKDRILNELSAYLMKNR